jgi:hypothetical protein
MTCTVFGPGLVGCYLGAAASATAVVAGPSGRVRTVRVRLPVGERDFAPRLTDLRQAAGPLLVASRAHRTPWDALPSGCLAAQNGLGQPVPVAVCFLAVDLDGDGVLHATGAQPRVAVGPLSAGWRPVIAAWREAGIAVDELADVAPAQWEKAILNATVGPLCLASGLGMAAVWRDPDLRRLVVAATHEGEAIALSNGIAVTAGLADRAAAFFDRVGDHRPSVVADPGELPWVLGRLRTAARAPAPALERIAAMVAAAVSPAQAPGRGIVA